MNKPDMLLWLDDHRGIFIPRDFASSFADREKSVFGVAPDEWKVLEAGPEHEYYWDVWISVCDNAIITDEKGVKYVIHQDGACWLVPVGMEWSEEEDTYVWPKEDAE